MFVSFIQTEMALSCVCKHASRILPHKICRRINQYKHAVMCSENVFLFWGEKNVEKYLISSSVLITLCTKDWKWWQLQNTSTSCFFQPSSQISGALSHWIKTILRFLYKFSPRFPSGLPKTIQSSIFGWVAWDTAICLGTFLHYFILLTLYRYAKGFFIMPCHFNLYLGFNAQFLLMLLTTKTKSKN